VTAIDGNPRVVALPPSGIRTINDRKRPTSIDLSIGQPSIKPDPAPFVAASDWVREHGCPYAPYAGVPELRAAVAGIYGGRFHDKPENVLVTNGSQEAIYLAIKALLQPGRDEVLLVDPCYPSYARCCTLEGISWRAVAAQSADRFRVRIPDILEALTPMTRMIVLGTPSNPTGSMLSRTDVEALTSALSARSGPPVWVLVDEVYRELTFTPEGFAAMNDSYPHTLVVQSLSKSCALTGLRLGFLIGSEPAIQLATRIHMVTLMSTSMFSQRVAVEIVSQPERLRAHRPWYERQRSMMLAAARDAAVPILEPEGAFYAMVPLPARWTDDSLAGGYALLEEFDVVTVHGSVFGKQAEGYLRMTWAADEASVREGVGRIGEFLRKHA
jgi:aspartate/methionine/tyrosine aminotransferase